MRISIPDIRGFGAGKGVITMKKWLALVCTLMLMLGPAAGCSAHDKGQNEIKIGLSMATRDRFLTSLQDAAARAAAQAGLSLSVANANNDQRAQTVQIEAWAKKGYAAVAVVLCQDDAAAQVLRAAGSMPVVFVNRHPADMTVLQSRTNVLYLGSREQDAGRMQGAYLAEYFLARGNKAPAIAVFHGREGNLASDERISAAKQALTDAGLYPNYVHEVQADWERSAARRGFIPFLKAKPQIDGVLAANDEMAIGAAEALSQVGYKITDVVIAGVDATEDGRAAIRSGSLDFTAFQDPEAQGAGAIALAMDMLGGSSPQFAEDSIHWLSYQPVTAENIDVLFPDER